jgi:transposase InsO family protein
VGEQTQRLIVRLRRELVAAGFDAGAQSIAYALHGRVEQVPSTATIWRILKRQGLITPQPQKRPRSSYIRFQAELPNETWQADPTYWRLKDGTEVQILNMLDDHSRFLLASDSFFNVNGNDVARTFHNAGQEYGYPASFLSDNGCVFTARYRNGKVVLESELERLGIQSKHSRPYHPQTCGKVERFHQTLKRYLRKQRPARTLAQLQLQIDTFRAHYNQKRPHRALHGRTPLVAYNARLKAGPAEPLPSTHYRVRLDRVCENGTVTLRYRTRLYHIALGRGYKHQLVRLLVADRHIAVSHEDGTLIRELTLDPSKNYQPQERRRFVADVVRQVSTMS